MAEQQTRYHYSAGQQNWLEWQGQKIGSIERYVFEVNKKIAKCFPPLMLAGQVGRVEYLNDTI